MGKRLINRRPSLFKLVKYSQGIFSYENNEWNFLQSNFLSFNNWRHAACMLARKHYSEYQREYPIGNVYHLYKVIQSEVKSIAPFEGKVFWAITRFELKNWQVTYWAVPQDVVDELSGQFLFVIPESLALISSAKNESLSCYGEGNESVFVYKSGDVSCSLLADGMINSLSRFASVVNRYDLLDSAVTYHPSQVDALLKEFVENVQLYKLPGLMLSTNKEKRKFNWSKYRTVALSFIIPLVIYASFFSWFIAEKNTRLDIELQERRADMSQLLSKEKKLNSATQTLLEYKRLEEANPGLSKVLVLLSSLITDGTKIEGLELVGKNVTVRGTTTSATTFFSALSGSTQTQSVEFLGAISEDRLTKMEKFAIKFEFIDKDLEVTNEQ